MAYCGILNEMTTIGGNPVDLSRLDEGIVMAGGEEYDADDLISDEEELDLFNDVMIRTKADLLKNIDRLLEKIKQEKEENAKYSSAFYDRYIGLVGRFRAEVEEKTFPDKLEDWWRYEYKVRESGVILSLCHIDYFRICRDDSFDEDIDTEFKLLQVKTKLLTVEQYAQAYGVTTTAVRQWIRRGKIRTAMKMGSEWRIPELAECMGRGYQTGRFERKEELTDLPAEYAFYNEYDFVIFVQDRKQKNLFNVTFGKYYDVMAYANEEDGVRENYREMQMNQKEREKFELYLIANPFVEVSETWFAHRG